MSHRSKTSRRALGVGTFGIALSIMGWNVVQAQDETDFIERPGLNFYGVTGLIDTPSAQSMPDGQLSVTVSSFGGLTRTTLSFQMLPRVEGSFRYSRFGGLNFVGFENYYDRSFDISLRVLDESRYLPSVKIGLQDFVGTGLLSGEYIVATKTLTPKLRVTGGLGWGRLGSYNDIGSPLGDRDRVDVGTGGKPNYDQWFRGPVAPFAGIEYKVNDQLTLLAEYSSDVYAIETGNDRDGRGVQIFERNSPLNFGVDYRYNDALTFGGYYMYGSELGVNVNLSFNPYNPPIRGSRAPAPQPVIARPSRASDPDAYATRWTTSPNATRNLLTVTQALLDPEGVTIESMAVDAGRVDIRVRSDRYDAPAQLVGRVMRALTTAMPASVETFRIVPVSDGLAASAVTLRRSDIEALESAPQGSSRLLAVAGFADAGPPPAGSVVNAGFIPRFQWSLGPYTAYSYFDPAEPVRYELGAQLKASYEPTPGLVFSGAIRKRIIGNIDDATRLSNSVLPRVRTDAVLYSREGDPSLQSLQGAYYFKPAADLYGRVSLGYLEQMFGGVSGEVLWKPVSSRLALGAELNYVRQRDYDLGLGFRDYDVMTGHVSAYYSFDNGYHVQVDVGRYLAGDYGATLYLDREFRNGWKVGAFATLTDVSSEDFGEGSFDKGIRLTIPVSWFLGTPETQQISTVIRPVQRDGGAKLNVTGRLYEKVRGYHRPAMEDQWGRVWR